MDNLYFGSIEQTHFIFMDDTQRQCCGSGSAGSVSFSWIRIRIKSWTGSGYVSDYTDPDQTKTIENSFFVLIWIRIVFAWIKVRPGSGSVTKFVRSWIRIKMIRIRNTA